MNHDLSKEAFRECSDELLGFLQECPTVFHSVNAISRRLDEAGFIRLEEGEAWRTVFGGRYYVMRNGSSLIAFTVGDPSCVRIAAAHGDYPTFKLKEIPELKVKGHYLQLNTEGYGGMICSTWFDRPLSVAGRVIIRDGQHFVQRLVRIDRDLVLIPSLAIHMNRDVNNGCSYNKQIDTIPLFADLGDDCSSFRSFLAAELGIDSDDIYGSDLYLYNRMPPSVWGREGEYISSPHLDDMQCGFAGMKALLNSENSRGINVFACYDNEEVGSGTRQGAESVFLESTLKRLFNSLGLTVEDYERAIACGFAVSADNAHAVHPNHPGKTDEQNCVYMNGGIVIKQNAAQKYTSDAVSTAMFRAVCSDAGVPVQFFANRSDEAGGSTLGNISSTKVPVRTVDIGLPQLAMHSAYETAGMRDTLYLIAALEQFFNSDFSLSSDGFSIG